MQIEQLLANRQTVFVFPFKCYYQFLPVENGDDVSQIAITVPKKMAHRAVDRNRIKRWTREAYRLHNKQIFHSSQTLQTHVLRMLFVCINKEALSFSVVEKSVMEILKKIAAKDSSLC